MVATSVATSRETFFKVRLTYDCFFIGAVLNVMDQDTICPAIPSGHFHIKFFFNKILTLREEGNVMGPANF
jgi:hypothetical protein